MQKILKELFDQFVKTNGREPDNLEMILIRQKASAEDIRKRKIISMFDRSPVNADKPILGGQNIEETDAQILERLNKGNENSLSNMRYENAVKAEEAKAAADEDYIMKVFDPEDFSKGGRAGYSDGNIVYDGEGPIQFDLPFGEPMFTMNMNGKLFGIYKQKNGSHLSVPLGKDGKVNYAKGGRAGYYGGGQAMVGEDLSQIGHGADALMARNMQLSPNSMATTSTGLNYLLGEDNDTVRVPYNKGNMVLPKPKPKADPMVELLRVYNLYQESMPGVSQDTKKYLQQDFIQKLNDAGISQEAFMTNKMQNNFADGGPARKGFKGGGSDASTTSFSQSYDKQHGTNTASRANKSVDAQQAAGQRDADRTNDRISNFEQNVNHEKAMRNYQKPPESILKNIYNTGSEINYLKNIYNKNPVGLGISYGLKRYGPSVMEKLKNLRSEADIEEDGIMQMAELNDMQKKMLSGPQKQLKDIMGISNEEILQNISPFNTEETPATIEDVNKFYAAEGGPARQNFRMGKRAFLKMLGGFGAGIAGLKTGLLGFGKKGSEKVAKEVVKEAATGGAPVHFLKLVAKIKSLGDDAKRLAVKDKENVTTYKDYTLTEDVVTGEQSIQRMKVLDDDSGSYYGQNLTEETYMSYKPGKSLADETTKGKNIPDEYEEGTAYLRSDREYAGEIVDEVSGVSDDIFEEVGEEIPKIIRKEKADGGRIGYAGGKKVVDAIIKKANKKLGKKAVKTADKAEIPKETLLRDMFTDTNKRLNKKREMTVDEYDDIDISQGMIDLDEMNFTKNAQAAKNKIDNMDVNQKIKEGVASIMKDTSPAALEKSIEIDNLMLKYPGMNKQLAEQIATDTNPKRKADVIAMVEQTFKMSEKGMSGDDIIQTFKNTTRTKQATGGLASILG